MTGTIYTCLHTNQSRSYLNHLVHTYIHNSTSIIHRYLPTSIHTQVQAQYINTQIHTQYTNKYIHRHTHFIHRHSNTYMHKMYIVHQYIHTDTCVVYSSIHRRNVGKLHEFLNGQQVVSIFTVACAPYLQDFAVATHSHDTFVSFHKNCSSQRGQRPSLWSSGQSFWLQIQRSRVRFPALPYFLSSSGSGTGSTQPREFN